VVWWDLNNYGSPTTGDYGLVSSGSPEPLAAGTPFPPYYGEELASLLTTPGSRLSQLAGLPDGLLGFQSDPGGQGGQRHVLLVNSGSAGTSTRPTGWFAAGSTVQSTTYSAASSSTPAPLVTSSGPVSTRVTLPASSIVVLSGAGKAATGRKRG
jgi:hypothetical protein